MKIVTLNTWDGKLIDKLIPFYESQKDTTDVFCLQEVSHTESTNERVNDWQVNQLSVLQNMLGEEFEMYFTSRQDGYLGRDPVEFHLEYGVAMFVRKKRNPTNFRSVFVLGEKDQFPSKSKSHAVCIQIVSCLDDKGYEVCIVNIHGLHQSNTMKEDTPERMIQSNAIVGALEEIQVPIVLCGDFNLNPNTKALKYIRDKLRLDDIVKKYNIKGTRTSYYSDEKRKKTPFADYFLVSEKYPVKSCRVFSEEVSDHAGLELIV